MRAKNRTKRYSLRADRVVKATWKEARVLTGFMEDQYLRTYAAEHLAKISEQAQVRFLTAIEASRQERNRLPAIPLDATPIRPATNPQIESIRTDSIFLNSFKDRPYQFAWVDPGKIVAIQADVSLPIEKVPEDPDDLIDYFLPHAWEIPVEIAPSAPGTFVFLSSYPHIASNPQPVIEVEHSRSKLIVRPPQHLNLTQVLALNGRLFCRNGHNRIAAAIKAGLVEIPVVLVQGVFPPDIALGAPPQFFDPGMLLTVARPPLVADLLGPASTTIPVRERRYGFGIQISTFPLNHPI